MDAADYPMRQYTPEEMAVQFSPAAWHPDREATLAGHIAHGAEVAERLHPLKDVRYGPGPLQTMDIFPARKKGSPLCIALHGGLWRGSDKRAFLYFGERLAEAGIGYFVLNFDMCPAIDIEGIIQQVRDATAWIHHNAAEYQCDPAQMFVFGHATGAQLGAELLTCDWKAYPGFDPSALRGSLLVSGLYDLRYFTKLKLNETLKLTAESAARCSPLLKEILVKSPIAISVAANETPEFIEQTRDMAVATVKAGISTNFRIVPDVGHFDILDSMLTPDSVLYADFIQMVDQAKAAPGRT